MFLRYNLFRYLKMAATKPETLAAQAMLDLCVVTHRTTEDGIKNGVTMIGSKYTAHISVKRSLRNLGYYDTYEEAEKM